MGLESLFLFTLLGGMAAGAYAFETCFQRTRTGERPWLVPLVIVVLFAVGMIAASTHVQSIPRALASVSAGTVNFGSGMVKEVAASGIFFVLVIVDLIITLAKKNSPFALRVVAAVVAVVCMALMATAYVDVYGNAVWSNAPATVLSFFAGDLAMGLGLCAVLGSVDVTKKPALYALLIVDAALAIGLALEVAAFGGQGASPSRRLSAWWLRPSLPLRLRLRLPNSRTRKCLRLPCAHCW